MKERIYYLVTLAILLAATFVFLSGGRLCAKEVFKYSCSAQIYQAFENERLDAYTEKTGIAVKLTVDSSYLSFLRLMNGLSDVASTAERLNRVHKEIGFVETPFCKDPLAVITNSECTVKSLTEEQLRDIFSGVISNWKEVGGPDKEIIRIVPGKNTAAYKNFHHQVMLGRDIDHDVMTSKSTMVIEVTRNMPWSVSFIAQGAAAYRLEGIRMIRINGLAPGNSDYPYYQVFSFVTSGIPAGPAKTFIDFALSEEGKRIMLKRGMLPYDSNQ
jgi:phosphate transport system substrate-binding protein